MQQVFRPYRKPQDAIKEMSSSPILDHTLRKSCMSLLNVAAQQMYYVSLQREQNYQPFSMEHYLSIAFSTTWLLALKEPRCHEATNSR